uniref:Uncharacterized protein n=1 Tax=Oryza punctata TaxID=4537 RepID=A0A0E0L5Y1_ORYPU
MPLCTALCRRWLPPAQQRYGAERAADAVSESSGAAPSFAYCKEVRHCLLELAATRNSGGNGKVVAIQGRWRRRPSRNWGHRSIYSTYINHGSDLRGDDLRRVVAGDLAQGANQRSRPGAASSGTPPSRSYRHAVPSKDDVPDALLVITDDVDGKSVSTVFPATLVSPVSTS